MSANKEQRDLTRSPGDIFPAVVGLTVHHGRANVMVAKQLLREQKGSSDIMARVLTVLAILSILMPGASSCIFDAEKDKPDPDKPPPAYKPLDEKDNLLDNLELAYNQRNAQEYSKLLDPAPNVFVFHFSPTDIAEGKVKSSQWDVAKENDVTAKMFSRRPPAPLPPAESISLELTYTAGDDAYIPVTPASHPNETWYEKPVEYRLTVTIGATTYTQNKTVLALFTMRFTEVAGDSVWQITTWRDDVGN